jgi:hypothetical protein
LTPIFATKDVTIDGTFIPGSASGETYVDGSVLNVGNFNSGDLVFRTFDSGTSGAFEDSPLTADNVALGFAGGTENGPQGDVLQIGLNDPFFDADADYDDMRLAAQVVPLPGAAVLFLSGLVGVGAATRRMRGRNGDGAATA